MAFFCHFYFNRYVSETIHIQTTKTDSASSIYIYWCLQIYVYVINITQKNECISVSKG